MANKNGIAAGCDGKPCGCHEQDDAFQLDEQSSISWVVSTLHHCRYRNWVVLPVVPDDLLRISLSIIGRGGVYFGTCACCGDKFFLHGPHPNLSHVFDKLTACTRFSVRPSFSKMSLRSCAFELFHYFLSVRHSFDYCSRLGPNPPLSTGIVINLIDGWSQTFDD